MATLQIQSAVVEALNAALLNSSGVDSIATLGNQVIGMLASLLAAIVVGLIVAVYNWMLTRCQLDTQHQQILSVSAANSPNNDAATAATTAPATTTVTK